MNKHQNLEPYKCGVCNTSFTFPTDLPCHLHIHNENDTRYACPQKGYEESFATARCTIPVPVIVLYCIVHCINSSEVHLQGVALRSQYSDPTPEAVMLQ